MKGKEQNWPVIDGDLVGGNEEDLAVIKMLKVMMAKGGDFKEIKKIAKGKGVLLVK